MYQHLSDITMLNDESIAVVRNLQIQSASALDMHQRIIRRKIQNNAKLITLKKLN